MHLSHAQVHDDGDGEDLTEEEAVAAVALYRAAGDDAVNAAREASHGRYENRLAKRGMRASTQSATSPEKLRNELLEVEDGLRGPLRHAGSKWESRSGDRSRWLLRLKRASDVASFAELLVELESVVNDVGEAPSAAREKPPWRTAGDAWIGRPARRFFKREDGPADAPEEWLISDGKITSWLPPDGSDDALWHMVHKDGDEEDLERFEVAFAIEAAAEGRMEPSADEKAKLEELACEQRDDDDAADDDDVASPADEPSDEDDDEAGSEQSSGDEDDDAPSDAATGLTLWRSVEGRARWLSAMAHATSAHTLALGIVALRAHAALLRPLAEASMSSSRRRELDRTTASFYHSFAFGGAPKAAKGGRGDGKRARFTSVEMGYLRQGHRLFGGASARGKVNGDWIERTMERFAFHKSRTVKTLKQKWLQMHR